MSPGVRNHAVFAFCVKGRGWCKMGAGLHLVRPGDLLVLPPMVGSSCDPHAASPWTVIWVRATGALLSSYLRELGIVPERPVLSTGNDPQLQRLLHETVNSLRHDVNPHSLLRASHAFAYFLAILIDRTANTPADDSDAAQKVAQTIIFMSENLDRAPRVTALARLARLSPAYFSALFKQQTGSSPRDYLHLLRIHRACELLRTELSIKAISSRLGYRDPFHFSRQFKEFHGLSPSEYRNSRPR